jgi:hypothetical protein
VLFKRLFQMSQKCNGVRVRAILKLEKVIRGVRQCIYLVFISVFSLVVIIWFYMVDILPYFRAMSARVGGVVWCRVGVNSGRDDAPRWCRCVGGGVSMVGRCGGMSARRVGVVSV